MLLKGLDVKKKKTNNQTQPFPGVELAEIRSLCRGGGDLPGRGRGAAADTQTGWQQEQSWLHHAGPEPLQLLRMLRQPGHF